MFSLIPDRTLIFHCRSKLYPLYIVISTVFKSTFLKGEIVTELDSMIHTVFLLVGWLVNHLDLWINPVVMIWLIRVSNRTGKCFKHARREIGEAKVGRRKNWLFILFLVPHIGGNTFLCMTKNVKALGRAGGISSYRAFR